MTNRYKNVENTYVKEILIVISWLFIKQCKILQFPVSVLCLLVPSLQRRYNMKKKCQDKPMDFSQTPGKFLHSHWSKCGRRCGSVGGGLTIYLFFTLWNRFKICVLINCMRPEYEKNINVEQPEDKHFNLNINIIHKMTLNR